MQTEIKFLFKTFGDFVTAYSVSVSKGGFPLQGNRSLVPGARVKLDCKLRNDYPLISGEGEIVKLKDGSLGVHILQLEPESEKFLNEVVKVKAATQASTATLPAYEVQVSGAASAATPMAEEAWDVPADIFAEGGAEEVIEDVETAELADDISVEAAEPTETNATEELEFSSQALDVEVAEPSPPEDPLGGTFDEPAQAVMGEDAPGEVWEEVEPAPANPAALFEDVEVATPPGDVPAEQAGSQVGEATVGGSTTLFNRVSALRERKALLVGVVAGVVLLVGGVVAYVFLGSDDSVPVPSRTPAVQTAAHTASVPVTLAAVASTQTVSSGGEIAQAVTISVRSVPGSATAPVGVRGQSPIAQPVPAQVFPPSSGIEAERRTEKPASGTTLDPATKITGVTVAADGAVTILGDGRFDQVKSFGMPEPNRIVVDVYGVSKAFAGWKVPGRGAVAFVRPGEHPGKVRFVLDLKDATGKLPAHRIEKDGARLVVYLE